MNETKIISNVTTVDTEYLNKLKEDSLELECLHGAGVDNWDGYDYAMEVLVKALKNKGI